MSDFIVLYEYYTIIPDNNLGYIFEVNDCKYVKSNGDVGFMSGEEARVQAHKIEKKINKAYNSWVQYSSYKYPKISIIYVREDFKEMFEKYRKPGRTYTNIMKRISVVYTDQIEHTARRYSAWLPPIQCTLSGHQCMMLIQV